MANALAKSKAVLDKQSASLTPWSVYLASFPKSREVLDIDADLDTIEKDLPRLTPEALQVKQLGQLAAAVHPGQDWEVLL